MKRFIFSLMLIAALLLTPTSKAFANVRTTGNGDLPFYARSDAPLPHNAEWAFIVFYRPPECVPTDFNLLDFFDIPGAFSCGPYTTDGFAIWKNGPGIDPAPIQSELHGLGAVPVWFVSWPALESAIADGVLTITDLEAMPSLRIGSASFYHETLHPSSMIEMQASGIMEGDGRSFNVHSVTNQQIDITQITFR